MLTLGFVVDGKELWREQWGSDYMLIDPPEFPNGEVSRSAYVCQGLVRALESVSVGPFDSTSYVNMAESVDSNLLRKPPREQITLAYGYETVIVVLWDSTKRSFRPLWGS